PSEQVAAYYDNCHDAYRKYHSSEGAVHMALNDSGRFDADGFYGQLRRIESRWLQSGSAQVLELGFGQGFNLAYLATRHTGCSFAGIDLTGSHVAIASRRLAGLHNVQLVRGDFHRLPFADAAFDELYGIESFCHAQDVARAFAEAARVLRPGGRFTLFDGYLPRSAATLQADESLAVELVARGLAIEGLQVQDELIAAAARFGLQLQAAVVLDEQVLPSLRRLERTTGAVIRWPWLGRRALARRDPARGRNVLAGYLMRSTVEMGLIGYREIVLVKR
ncbi:MAG TPA: class I SAM-dependent methyltransferase, partial [Rubrivivax sp.]|nr:class I SAM-dependent methyltransferase [Rubrivivax sp.]